MICQVGKLKLSSVNSRIDKYLRYCSHVVIEMLRLVVSIDEQCNNDANDNKAEGN